MILQGNVKGGTYPVTQQEYEKPIDGTRACPLCGRKFAPMRNRRYCSPECRKAAYAEKNRENSRKYARKMSRARRACA